MATIKNSASINMTADRCTQRIIRSVYATAQSDRSLGWAGLGADWSHAVSSVERKDTADLTAPRAG